MSTTLDNLLKNICRNWMITSACWAKSLQLQINRRETEKMPKQSCHTYTILSSFPPLSCLQCTQNSFQCYNFKAFFCICYECEQRVRAHLAIHSFIYAFFHSLNINMHTNCRKIRAACEAAETRKKWRWNVQ